MTLIGQHQQTVFSNPQNGQTPMDADTVRGNDNALQAKHNNHDNDATIHVQTGLLANRPAFGTPYAMYMDENQRLYADTGSAWVEIPYARLGAASNTMTGNLSVGGTLGVTGATTLGAVTAGAVTATTVNATLSGNGAAITGITVNASGVTAGTFPGASYTFGAGASGQILADSVSTYANYSQTGATKQVSTLSVSGAVSYNIPTIGALNLTLTGNTVVTLNALGGALKVVDVFVRQDGTGGHTLGWVNVTWPGAVVPVQTATAGRMDWYRLATFGSVIYGVRMGADFA